MSGHSKWSTIKHQKGVTDARRGQLFTKLTREIIASVREGGPNVDSNFHLRLAIQKARDSNMPTENIDRAIMRGGGGAEGSTMVEMTIEGYANGGAAILVRALTDNRNRTLQEVRNAFSRNGGSLGENGSVAWLFEPKGVIAVGAGDLDAEELGLLAIDAGADDIKVDGDSVEIYTTPHKLEEVRKTLEEKGIPVASTELSMVPKTTIELEEKAALQTLKLLEKLEEVDGVQTVYSNANFPNSVLEKYELGIQG